MGGADEQLEKSLSEREDPLIDLGLACYGANAKVVGALYEKATAPPSTPMKTRYRKGLRIACLSNQCVGVRDILGKFPDSIIGSEETRRVLAEADWDVVVALMWNPYISDNLLQALYERTGDLAARYRRRCEQLHKRYRYFNPRPTAEWLVQDTAEVEQHPLGKLAAWALTSDTKAADLAKQVQYIKKSLEWGFVILVALISYLHWR